MLVWHIAMIPGETKTSGGLIRFPYSVVVLCLSHNLGGNTTNWPLDITRYYCLLVGALCGTTFLTVQNVPVDMCSSVQKNMHDF